jgi:hypothetical protein
MHMSEISERFQEVQDAASEYLREASTLRGLLIIVLSIAAAWLLIKIIARFTVGR